MDIAREILLKTWETLVEMSPFLLFGFLVAGILYVFIRPELVERHLGGRGILQVVKASLLGVPLPLCSCGVIPVSASLRRHGAGRGATTSFLISTPQTGVDSIMVTLSLLGPVFAIFRPLFAFVSGIFGGAVVNAFDREEERRASSPAPASSAGFASSPAPAAPGGDLDNGAPGGGPGEEAEDAAPGGGRGEDVEDGIYDGGPVCTDCGSGGEEGGAGINF